MRRVLSAAEAAALPGDVIIAAQGVSRALPPPVKGPPRWLARILPKGGLAGNAGVAPDDPMLDDDDEEDDDFDDLDGAQGAALEEISFDVRAGEGLGILGEDRAAIATLVRILIGGVPPTTGRVLVRGLVAPISNRELQRLLQNTTDRKSVNVIARYFHWPRSVIDSRWAEIEEFAALEELNNVQPVKRMRQRSLRLAVSAALHMNATAYVLDPSLHDDPAFDARCLELIAQRKAEGAAVVQAARKGVEDVARLAETVIWIEDGRVRYRGQPVDVAKAVHENTVEKIDAYSEPVRVRLADAQKPVRFATGPGHVDFEVHVLRKNLEIGFALELMNGNGKAVEVRNPDRSELAEPGAYTVGLTVPDGLLDPGSYRARLIAEIAVTGHEPAPPRELLAFDVVVAPADDDPAEDGAPEGFMMLPVAEVELEAEPEDAQWDVSRTGS